MLEKTAEIYPPVWGCHRRLGDCLNSLNYLVHKAMDLGKCLRISDHQWTRSPAGPIPGFPLSLYYNFEKLMVEGEKWFVIVKDSPTVVVNTSDFHKNKNRPYLTNKYQFDKKNVGSNLIAYQFDLRGKRTFYRKFPSPEIQAMVTKTIEEMGFTMTRIGDPLTLEQSSEILSKVECFVGVPSGMGWVAATTRTPSFFVANSYGMDNLASDLTGYQTYIVAQDYIGFLENIRKYKEDRDFYDKNCVKVAQLVF